MKFTLRNGQSFRHENYKGVSYNAAGQYPAASCSLISIDGRHGKVKGPFEKIFFVIEGHGEFTVANMLFDVQQSDVVMVPANVPHDFRGKMKILLTCVPAFDPGKEKKLDK
ncbi:MAG: cupin domain-containing protein [Candidatus Aenigmarchaeota archaeon]|nr:cupin domain-containing protein [Candidatus Aenigmarchaeota archaeon]